MKKLRCFRCTHKFKDKKEIFRDYRGHPKCEDCFRETLEHDWSDEFADDIVNETRRKFGGIYKKWEKNFYENNEECKGHQDHYFDPMYFPKHMLTEINGKKYCEACMEENGLEDQIVNEN